MTTHFLGDTAVLTGRSLTHIARSPDTIVTTAVTPIAIMLMFVLVFGGAIDIGDASESYVAYLLPGILLITVASGISYTAYRLFLDMQSGIFERFQSMPIARASVLWAHVLTSLVANLVSLALVVGVALLMGFRTGADLGGWLAVLGIMALFTLALTWLAVIPGLTASSVEGASAFSYPLIFLPFISSAFAPRSRCRDRCAGSPSTSRSPRSSTRSARSSPVSRWDRSCGSRSGGASASSCSRSPWPS
jgi:ABC-2 type transport system permease protein